MGAGVGAPGRRTEEASVREDADDDGRGSGMTSDQGSDRAADRRPAAPLPPDDARTTGDYSRSTYADPWHRFSRYSGSYDADDPDGRAARDALRTGAGALGDAPLDARKAPAGGASRARDVSGDAGIPPTKRFEGGRPWDAPTPDPADRAFGRASYGRPAGAPDAGVRGTQGADRAGSRTPGRGWGARSRGSSRYAVQPAPAPAVAAPAAPEPGRHRRRVRPGRVVLAVLVALVVAMVALYMAFFRPIDERIAFEGDEAQQLSQVLSPHIPLTPSYTLLLGSDAREGDTVSRTDTIILVRIDPITNRLTMVSIPRDTKVDLGEYGTQKINAAYAFGGAALAVSAVEQLTGVSVSRVAVIDFDGLSSLVDAIGGVTVTVPVDVNDPDYTGLVLAAGTYDMDGATALSFVRVRHGFADGDYQRQEDQRILIQAILDKLLSHPTLIPAAASALGDVLTTNYACYQVLPLLARMSVGSPTIYSASIPSTTATIDGVSYVVADEAALQTMMQVVEAGGDPSTVANGLE
jgi:LCP family protein required for cell wall assembly